MSGLRRIAGLALLGVLAVVPAAAHPLGNFTVNHYSRLEVGPGGLSLRYVVDMAEIAALPELQRADAGGSGNPSPAELEAFAEEASRGLAPGLALTVDGAPVPLRARGHRVSTPAGMGGLRTLRLQVDYRGSFAAAPPGAARRLRYEDRNHPDRIGWREIVAAPGTGVSLFDSSAYGSGVTDELRSYPADLLSLPLRERSAELSFRSGPAPPGAAPLRRRDGQDAVREEDPLAALITVPHLTLPVMLLGLLAAMVMGGFHALSPGHGKTVVGAYLVGTRGTARHALFLGLTVTITHTAGVFALGLITLFASQHVLPERLYGALSFFSGATVALIGGSLFLQRLGALIGAGERAVHGGHRHDHGHGRGAHAHTHDHDGHSHDHRGAGWHSHGGSGHSHLPPGADGSTVTWRSLLALGVSGGLLPCPSALIVLLSAVALNRTAYGLLLVTAFSLGLAAVLTGVGLLFVWAGRLLPGPSTGGALWRVAPTAGAFVVMCAGALICWGALR